MKRNIAMIILFCSLSVSSVAQPRIILDTDIDSDVDDVEAVAMVHALADQHKAQLLGIIVTSDDPYAPTCVSALNKYFGRPRLPVGFLTNQKEIVHKERYKYTKQISEEFPGKLKSYQQAQDAVSLYRKLLSKSPDGSVVIITIGHLTSLQNLLKSTPDKISSLTGQELVEKKVSKWLCMGGYFPAGKEANFFNPDPLSTVYCLQQWNKPVVFSGWEIGKDVITGGQYLRDNISKKSPVYRAYQLYNNFAGRSSWDQTAIILLLDEWKKFFDTVKQGYCYVSADGSNKWMTDKDSPYQEYLVFKPDADGKKLAKMLDDLVITVSK
ncbi:nucleoside hydrolase [Segetibacter aerophilus]|uniref:Nucleoside hydrolase n=1 Tax=Segetibacter aerophilus TaxID=670293 RepID=A0A512BGZ7_9BACT|nr:nucleoside hydrolase [Segetibacter aerophilus]GEO11087.1 nucleoside hydrolase [Segetibacter aerophilus]